MNVDIAALRLIEREKEISFDTVVQAIETALLTAYKHTDGPQPAMLETSRPGVLAVGDVRSGSIKRVASAVGEGSIAVSLVHLYLETV